MKLTPLQLVARTPKTNCGACGFPTCLAFGAAVSQGKKLPWSCPFLNTQGLEFTECEQRPVDQDTRDQEFIGHLQTKIAALELQSIAAELGAICTGEHHDILTFTYLGQNATVSKEAITLDGNEPEDHRDRILLSNYILSRGAGSVAGEWIGMESLPNSISKIKTLETYCEKRLAALFTGRELPELQGIFDALEAQPATDHTADIGVIIPVLPKISQYLLYWKEEPEENFDAKVKILFDRNVLDFLDLESLVFTAERLADRIIFLLQEHHSS